MGLPYQAPPLAVLKAVRPGSPRQVASGRCKQHWLDPQDECGSWTPQDYVTHRRNMVG